MKDRDTTARSRELGAELRRVRERAGYNGIRLARKLGWSAGRISRLESGKRGASEVDVAVFLAVCHVTGDEMEQLLELTRETYASTWLQTHGELIPDQLRTLAISEVTATRITSYEPLVVEGLVQTENYARALFHWCKRVPTEGVEARVRARMDRQRLLKRQWPPEVIFFIHEQALRSAVTDERVMNEQLLHLALVSGRPRCSIRVVPASAGPSGALGGPFRLMDYKDHGPVAYTENQTSSLFLEDANDIAIFRETVGRLAEVALSEGQSRELLVRLASEYDQPEEGTDELDDLA
jgi:transcriptional regulator with XRE-family HTH domain